MAELIAVSGAPGAGKTTVAIQLGLALSRKKQRTVVVFCDSACPPKEYLMRKCGAESLGAIIAADQLDQTATWTGVEVLSEFFGVVGYNPLDSEEQYPCATRRGCDQVVEALAGISDAIVFDLANDESDLMSETGRRVATSSVVVLTATPKDIAWAMRKRLLKVPEQETIVFNKYIDGQDLDYDNIRTPYAVPWSAAVKSDFEVMNAFRPVPARSYRASIDQLLRAIRKE